MIKLAEAITIIGLPIASIGLFIAIEQLKQSNKIANGQFLLEIKKMSRIYDEIHINLRPGGDWENSEPPHDSKIWIEIDDYMGFFEYCEFLMQDGSINPEQFANLFAYRIQNIIDNKSIYRAKIIDEREHWITFIKLIRRLQKMRVIRCD